MALSAPPPPSTGKEWPSEVANRIEKVVTDVRDKTTVPVQKVARALVYGLVAGFLATAAVVMLLIATFRLLHVYLPIHPEGRRVWIIYAALGAIFVASGGFLWRKRTPATRE